jgi:hypothetical protein
MKINEFNTKKVNEGKFTDTLGDISSSLFGQHATSAIGGMFTGKGTKHQLTQDIFLKDFYQDAITSIDNAVKGGILDLKNTGFGGDTAPDQQKKDTATGTEKPEVTPGAPESPNSPAGTTAGTSAAAKTPQATPATPGGQNIKITGNTGAKQAASVNLMQPKPVAKAAVQQGPKYSMNITGKTGTGIGGTAKPAAKQPSQAELDADQERMATGTNENRKFYELNKIFESILQVNEDTSETLSQYLYAWFGKYMAGTDWKSREATIKPIVLDIEQKYLSKGDWKGGLKKLAQAGYAIASASKAVPKGAQNAVPTGAEKKDASKKLDFGVHDSGVPPEIDQQMQKLQKSNPEAFKNYMAKYGKQ